mgnify:CR=1 FL=1
MSFSSLLGALLRSPNRNSCRNSNNACSARKLRIESLETRQLLAVLTVTTLADVVSSTDDQTSLREAITAAADGDTINFASEIIGGEIVLSPTYGALHIKRSVTIDAWDLPGAQDMPLKEFKGITICGAELYYPGAGNEEMLYVKGSGIDVTLRGLTFTNSKTVAEMAGFADNKMDGVAINCGSGVNLSVQNCAFVNLKYGAYGALQISADVFTMTNTLVADNIAVCDNCKQGAGVYFDGASGAMYNCTVANNTVYTSPAGATNHTEHGVYGASSSSFQVNNSVFIGHDTADFGAQNVSAPVVVKHSVYANKGTNQNSTVDNTDTEYIPATHGALFTSLHNNFYYSKYWLAPNSVAINHGDPSYVDNAYGYNLNQQNNNRGYDLAGNYRLKVVAPDDDVDAGAFSAGWNPVSNIVVTIEDDIVNHADDFFADGAPNRISLREAYEYIDRYYIGGNLNDFENSFGTTDGTDYGDHVYKTIRFASNVKNCYVTREIVSEKEYTIDGSSPIPGDASVTVHGTASRSDPGAGLAATDAVRIFNVKSGYIDAFNLNLKNTFARAKSDETSLNDGKGGAVYIAGGAVYNANGGEYSCNYAETSGGVVHVAEGASFWGLNLYVHHNQSSRGGAIANYGDVFLDLSVFDQNTADGAKFASLPGFDSSKTRGFGGAIYNAGNIAVGMPQICALDALNTRATSSAMIFTFNKALSVPAAGAQYLQGGSGGAIYNTLRNGVPAYMSIYHASFEDNSSSKYGGAIANFGKIESEGALFNRNISSSGGAIQNSGEAYFSSSGFSENKATISDYALTTDRRDFGGNGGAIFASGGPDAAFEYGVGIGLDGGMEFYDNIAENAGGAIDYINGVLSLGEAYYVFQGNSAGVVGGAVVATKEILVSPNSSFIFGDVDGVDVALNNNAPYAPNVAVTNAMLRDDVVSTMAQAFFGTTAPGRDKLDTFVRYGELTSEHKLTFEALAESFTTEPTTIYVSVDGAKYTALGPNQSLPALSEGNHVVRYYSSNDSNVIFRANIYVADDQTSVIASQIDLGERAYISPEALAAGVSLRVYPANSNPITSWTIRWGDGAETTIPTVGYACSSYHVYGAAGVYKLTLVTVNSANNQETYEDFSYCVVPHSSSAAKLDSQEEFFADDELLDELFIEF